MVELGSWLRGSVVEHSVTNSKADNVTVAGKTKTTDNNIIRELLGRIIVS